MEVTDIMFFITLSIKFIFPTPLINSQYHEHCLAQTQCLYRSEWKTGP